MSGTVMLWLVHSPSGELIATTRYACDAARLAICSGPGASVRCGGRWVLVVTDDTASLGALPIADRMIAEAYDSSRRPP